MTLSISDKKTFSSAAAIYLGFSVFAAIFSAVYEVFSHHVYSAFMICMFLWPLLLGALPMFIFSLCDHNTPTVISRCLWGMGIACLTFGSCVAGVLEIYGTTSRYTLVYWISGAAFSVAAITVWLQRIIKDKAGAH